MLIWILEQKKIGPDLWGKKCVITDLGTEMKNEYTEPDLDPKHVLLSGE